jgi:hypothetical protein
MSTEKKKKRKKKRKEKKRKGQKSSREIFGMSESSCPVALQIVGFGPTY